MKRLFDTRSIIYMDIPAINPSNRCIIYHWTNPLHAAFQRENELCKANHRFCLTLSTYALNAALSSILTAFRCAIRFENHFVTLAWLIIFLYRSDKVIGLNLSKNLKLVWYCHTTWRVCFIVGSLRTILISRLHPILQEYYYSSDGLSLPFKEEQRDPR